MNRVGKIKKAIASLIGRLNPTCASGMPSDSSGPSHAQVLFVNGCDLPALHRYRVSHQREQLELRGVSTNEIHYAGVDNGCAKQADVFVIYRCPITNEIESFIEKAHELGKKVWFDVDDLVIDTDYTNELPVVKSMRDVDRAIFNDGVERNGRTLRLCDGAIASTERLAHELTKYVPRVFINRNVASLEMLHCSDSAIRELDNRGSSDVYLGYFNGSMTHNADFAEVIPALIHIFDNIPNVYLKVVGDLELPSGLKAFSDRILCAEKVDWRNLPSLIASVDINLAPLERTLFNEAKSENKWTEAALVGIPTVATNFGAFSHSIKSGETGFLCSNTEEWIQVLTLLITDESKRAAVGSAARLYVKQHCVTATSGYGLAELLAGSPRDLDHICPTSEIGKRLLVDSYLEGRGYTAPAFEPEQSEPWKTRRLSEAVEVARRIEGSNRRILLLVYERECGDDATFRYFGANLEERLGSSCQWGSVHLFVDELAVSEGLIGKASAIMLIRCRVRPEILDLAKKAKRNQIPLAYFIDDNAIGRERAPRIIKAMASDQSNEYERDFWTGVCRRFELASDLCDSIVVPNSYFAESICSEVQKPVYILQSSLNDAQVAAASTIVHARQRCIDNRFTIGYFSGTSSHQDDFKQLEMPLISFLREHPDAVLVIGGHFSLSNQLYELYSRGSIVALPMVDYITLQYLQASVDVVLAPLSVDDFTNCKSALKVFEAGLVGTPACASNSFSYAEAIDEGKSGFLCATADEWESALEALYESENLRSSMGCAARERALSRYYGNIVLKNVEDLCGKIEETAIAPIDPSIEAEVYSRPQEDWDDPFSANPSFAR